MLNPTNKPTVKGQPKIAEWEKWRVIAWANEVHRRVIAKMVSPSLSASDPFNVSRNVILANWGKPRRKSFSPSVVMMVDLDMIFAAGQKSSFYKYTTGKVGRLRNDLLDEVERMLPGTRSTYDFGRDGIPLWPALAGQINAEKFWSPLLNNGSVSAILELDSGWYDWQDEGRVNPAPTGNAGTYEATFIVPTIPLNNLVQALSAHFAPYREPDMPIKADMIKVVNPSLGEATLVIALAQLALNDEKASSLTKQNLRALLVGCVPFWEAFDVASDTPKSEVAVWVKGLAAKL